MTFEEVFNKFKDDIVEDLVSFGEAQRVHKVLNQVELNKEDYRMFFESGQNNKGECK